MFGAQAPEDAVVFVVGVDGHGVTGYLVLDPASYERAFWTEAGALTIAQGGIVFVVRMHTGEAEDEAWSRSRGGRI